VSHLSIGLRLSQPGRVGSSWLIVGGSQCGWQIDSAIRQHLVDRIGKRFDDLRIALQLVGDAKPVRAMVNPRQKPSSRSPQIS
jgi:hypothetical protein